MEFFIVILILTGALFYVITFLFNKFRWQVINYKGKSVPYSLGTIFILLILMDYIILQNIVSHIVALFYLVTIWLLGFIDDRYGKPYPKGIRGHLKLFVQKYEISTGFLKAVGTVLVSLFYIMFPRELGAPLWISFLLLIFLPHTMNLLDTKPLRVWKVALIIITVPLLFLQWNLWVFGGYILILIMWAFYESRMLAMLGDNGATLIGALGAVTAVQTNMGHLITFLLLFSLCITWIAEKVSIQKWVENTPGLRQIDKLGRIE
ncbi:hypothetical protein J2S74_003654 [Evansella vedderi]|uniref:Uncharacterized protein n=1 Tax=Evansella vedderi TaxID=38282 RepID=A0ABT9ZYB3_9BACI|nr:hypothetical protein [Evansella vedderi]MDQ0256236.1 hypothetical protein [Evansella vedderi]